MNTGILQGTGVLVTRPAGQSAELTRAIETAGGYVFSFPALTINPRSTEAIRNDLAALSPPDIIIYVSRNAVLHGASLVGEHSKDGARTAAIGPATRAALTDAGCVVDIWPASGFDSEYLLMHAELNDVGNRDVLIVRGNQGRELLADTLRTRGAEVNYVAVYERVTASPDDQMLAQLQSEWHSGRIDVVIAMSVDSLTSLLKILPGECRILLKKALLVTPSKQVIQAALKFLPDTRAVLANGIQSEDLVNAIVQERPSSER